jgi:hypothetical protein
MISFQRVRVFFRVIPFFVLVSLTGGSSLVEARFSVLPDREAAERNLPDFTQLSEISRSAGEGARDEGERLGEQKDLEELQRARDEYQKAFQSLNHLNPFSAGYGEKKDLDPLQEGGEAFEQFGDSGKQLAELLNHPAVQGYLRFFQNPEFSEGMRGLAEHPRRNTLFIAQAVFFLLFIIFRAWRTSKSGGWFGRLWTKTWTFFAYVFVAVAVLPAMVLGSAYLDVLKGFLEVISKA